MEGMEAADSGWVVRGSSFRAAAETKENGEWVVCVYSYQ